VCLAKRGDRVEQGTPLAEVHARTDQSARAAVDEVLAAYELADQEPTRRPIVLETLTAAD
jgi:thymidine phosphorylase